MRLEGWTNEASVRERRGRLHVVAGGQFGSEGKGAIAAAIGHYESTWRARELVGVRVGGPNAGHTVVGPDGTRYPLRHLPTAAVIDPEATLVIAAGSEINEKVLRDEVDMVEAGGIKVSHRLYVDRQATMIDPDHIQTEQYGAELVSKIGSTGKGVGAARAERAMRAADLYGHREWAYTGTSDLLLSLLQDNATVIVEGTQGYGLGTHAGFYPYVTAGDCRAIDFLAQAGISPWWVEPWQLRIWLVVRPHPIRVAGPSGELPNEITWEQLSKRSGGYIQPEKTTVTKKVRRVADFDPALVQEALRANGARAGAPVSVAMTFLDYIFPEVVGVTQWARLPVSVKTWVTKMESEIGYPITLLGTGPSSTVIKGVDAW